MAEDHASIQADPPAQAQCLYDKPSDPFAMVVFGATGDLTARKILPALFTLFIGNMLPESFTLIGASRSPLSDTEFRQRMRNAAQAAGLDLARWTDFEPRLHYRTLQFEDHQTFTALATALDEPGGTSAVTGNRLFYLAVPPTAYEDIARNLTKAGLADETRGWARLVVEKPFGRDLASAQRLDRAIMEGFHEHQVFRIDHYLAKETVQNVLMFRFANAIFEPIWNRQYIKSVHITAAEALGVGHRAGYYDRAGVLRDMFQNHMMQLLSLCAMEPPPYYEADCIRDEKVKVYKSLRPFPTERLDEHLVLGQYAAGVLDGQPVPAYVEEPGVAPDSTTPTYASMKVFVDNWRWQGVPFHLTSGKRLAAKRTEMAVQFKEIPHSMFRKVLGEHITANRLILSVQPKEEVRLTFQAKSPGPSLCLRNVTMNFDYAVKDSLRLDAYEKVLLDILVGDQTLFWRQDGVDLCWGFLTPILDECDCPDRDTKLHLYRAGSDGPTAVQECLR